MIELHILRAVVALALVGAALAVLWRIAWFQRIQARSALFDRRFALYWTTCEQLDALLTGAEATEDSVRAFKMALASAPFLVDTHLATDLGQVGRSLESVRRLRAELAKGSSVDERIAMADRLSRESTWLSEFRGSIETRFGPLLDLRD